MAVLGALSDYLVIVLMAHRSQSGADEELKNLQKQRSRKPGNFIPCSASDDQVRRNEEL